MKNNEKQIYGQPGANLPIVSDKQEVQRNSMRLYVYLVSISRFEGKNKARTFTHKDFNVNQIKNILHMHPDTIKKYWELLELHGLIKYEGPAHFNMDWKKVFSIRKKDGATYYSIPKKSPYRIIPKETLDKMQNQFLVGEQELKLYLLLAELQERFCYMQSPERIFSLADLRDLLKLKNEDKTNKSIIQGLLWLKSLGLIEYESTHQINNLHKDAKCFYLKNVYYYTNGGEIANWLESSEVGVVSEEIKKNILESKVVEIF